MSTNVIMCILTGVYVIATIVLTIINVCALSQSKKQMKRAADIQLLNKYFAVANKIECNDYSEITCTELSILFASGLIPLVSQIEDLYMNIDRIESDLKTYNELIHRLGYDDDIPYEASLADATDEDKERNEAQEKKYAVVYDDPELNISYNGPELANEKKCAEKELKEKQLELKKKVFLIVAKKAGLSIPKSHSKHLK